MKDRILSLATLVVPVLACFSPASAFEPSHYAQTSNLGRGQWVKIAVDTTGVYEISFDLLRQYGFERPEAVAVYGYGGVMAAEQTFRADYADDIPQTLSIQYEGRLLFYAEGPERASVNIRTTSGTKAEAIVERNTFCSEAFYFLSDALPRSEAKCTDLPVSTDKPTEWHYCIDLIEREIQNPSKGGNIFHGAELKAGQSEEFRFHIQDFSDAAQSAGTVHVEAGARTPSQTFFPVSFNETITSSLDGVTVGANTSDKRTFNNAIAAATFAPADGKSHAKAKLTFTVPANFTGTYCAVDKVYIIYPRSNRMPAGKELFLNLTNKEAEKLMISDVTRNIELWDVTDPGAIVRLGVKHTDGQAFATAGGSTSRAGRRLLAFEPSASHRIPRFAGCADRQNIHAASVPELLIVTTESLRQEADELADIHRRLQGKEVLVASQEEAFNEFGGGTRSAAAIRRMVKMFADREPGRLRHVLLYGPSNYDNRGISTQGDYLVCYECEMPDQAKDISTNYVSDTYFGIITDNCMPENICTTKADIAVGRIPATDQGIARKINAKIERYLADMPSPAHYMRMLKFSDDGDYQSHFKNSELFAATVQKSLPAMTVSRADDLLFPRDEHNNCAEARRHLFSSLTRGQGLLFYSGHGKATSLCEEIDFNITNARGLRNNVLPLTVLSTCEAYPLDHTPANISNELLSNPDGGAIGIVGASRTVYLEHNHKLSMAIAEEYAAAKEGDTGADLLMRARNRLISQGMTAAMSYNTMCYNYCGDPAVPLAVPRYKFVVTTVDHEIKPGRVHKIEGMVVDADNRPVDNFNGTALIEVYDVPPVRELYIRNEADGSKKSTALDEMLLAEFPATVRNGRLSADIVIPANNAASGSGRIVTTATDAASGSGAAGVCTGISFADRTPDIPDEKAPEIIELRIEPEDYSNETNIKPTFTVHALIKPSASGLSTGFSTIHRACSLILDGTRSYTDATRSFSYDEEGLAHLSVRIGPLGSGPHTLSLEAVSNLGTSSGRNITFVVNPSPTSGRLVIDSPERICRSEAVFSLDDTGGVNKAHLIVTDLKGRTVLSRRGCVFPYTWNFNGDGMTIPEDGRYLAWAIISDGRTRTSTPKLAFTIVK